MKTQCVLLFVKYPEPGLVKTRLAADAGAEPAARLARAMVEDALDALKWLEDTDLILCFAPEQRAESMKHWLGAERTYWPQRGRDLGQRMKHAFASAFRKGYERAVLMGTDVPGVDDNAVRPALDSLQGDAVCIGPAMDGGYWLIGFTEQGYAPEAFTDVEWGSEQVLRQTLGWLEFSRKKLFRAATLQDVDTLADLRILMESAVLKPGSRTAMEARRLLERARQKAEDAARRSTCQ
jgi:hypothetical protein